MPDDTSCKVLYIIPYVPVASLFFILESKVPWSEVLCFHGCITQGARWGRPLPLPTLQEPAPGLPSTTTHFILFISTLPHPHAPGRPYWILQPRVSYFKCNSKDLSQPASPVLDELQLCPAQCLPVQAPIHTMGQALSDEKSAPPSHEELTKELVRPSLQFVLR